MELQKIVWTSLVDNSTELLTILRDQGFEVRGLVVGAVGEQPVGLSYQVQLDEKWNLKEVQIMFDGDETFEIHYTRRNNKWFDDEDNHMNDFDDADDIDITLTPFTNTLPINRLKLQEGESKDITVMYFDMTELQIYPAKQRYTNLGNNNYRFEHLDTGFMAIIEVNEDGFVAEYPGLFKMITMTTLQETDQ